MRDGNEIHDYKNIPHFDFFALFKPVSLPYVDTLEIKLQSATFEQEF